MGSHASTLIRAAFANNPGAPQPSLEVQRKDWEAAAAQAELPPNTLIEPIMADGVACEWVRCGVVRQHHALLHLHGGGFNAGSCKTHRELAARLSLATHLPVLLVDYRLAPEHPFPAGLHDTIAVYRWLLDQGTQPADVVIAGDSAGANLALAALVQLRDNGASLPAAAALLSPMLDLTLSGPSTTTRAHLDPLVTQAALARAVNLYLGDHDPKDALASPVYADLQHLPPMLIQVGDHELLLSDALLLAERAQAAAVDVKLEVWPEMWHVWHAFAAQLPEGQAALDQVGAYVRGKLMH